MSFFHIIKQKSFEMNKNALYKLSNILKLLTRKHSNVSCLANTPQKTRISILDNGIRVATEAKNSPLACISLFIEAGSRFEAPCNNGISHFIERMAFRGFRSMSRCELNELIKSVGAKFSTQTTREMQIFSASCLAETAPIIVDILSHIVIDLALDVSEIESAKQDLQLELIDLENDPKHVLFDYLHLTAFQETPLSKRVIGTSANIQQFDKLFTSAFMTDHYQPYKLGLVGVGNISHDDIVSNVQAKLGHMVCDPYFQNDVGSCRFTGSQVLFRDDSMPFVHVAVALEVPGYMSSDYFPLMVAKSMIGSWHKGMGGGENNGSTLARAASVAHLCDYFEAFYIPYKDIGLWGIYFISEKMNTEDMLYNVQKTWMEMCVTILYSDAERGINALKLDFARNFDSSLRSCYELGFQTMYLCGREGHKESFHVLKGIKHFKIKEVMEKWIYDRCPAVAAVGPTEALPDYTRIRSGQYWIRL